MKKTLILLAALLLAWSPAAMAQQTDQAPRLAHLAFNGIPLDGKVSKFGRELQKHGYQLHTLKGKSLKDAWLYVGKYFGEPAQLLVSFHKDTKTVYQATAVLTAYSLDEATKIYQKLQQKLLEQYANDPRAALYNKLRYTQEADQLPAKWFSEEPDGPFKATTITLPDVADNRLVGGKIRLFVRQDDTQAAPTIPLYKIYATYLDFDNYNTTNP